MSLSFSSHSSRMAKKQTRSSSELFLDGFLSSSPITDTETLSSKQSSYDNHQFSTTIVPSSWSPISFATVDNTGNNETNMSMDPNNGCSLISTSSPMMDIDNNDNETNMIIDPNNGCSLISTSSSMMDIDNNDNDTIIMDADAISFHKKKKMTIKMKKKSKLRLKLKNMKKKVMKIMKKSSVRVQQLKENEKMPKEKMMAMKYTVFVSKGVKALKRVTIKQKNQVTKRKSSQQPVSSKTIALPGGKRRKYTTPPCVIVEKTFSDAEIAVAEKKTAADADATASTLVVATTAATATATATATTPCVVAATAPLVANEEHCYDKKSDEDKISTSTSSTASLSSMSSSSKNDSDSDSSLSHNKDDSQPGTTVTALTPLTLTLPTTPKSVETMINFDWGYKDAINDDAGPSLQALRKEQQCNEEFGCNAFDCVCCR